MVQSRKDPIIHHESSLVVCYFISVKDALMKHARRLLVCRYEATFNDDGALHFITVCFKQTSIASLFFRSQITMSIFEFMIVIC